MLYNMLSAKTDAQVALLSQSVILRLVRTTQAMDSPSFSNFLGSWGKERGKLPFLLFLCFKYLNVKSVQNKQNLDPEQVERKKPKKQLWLNAGVCVCVCTQAD